MNLMSFNKLRLQFKCLDKLSQVIRTFRMDSKSMSDSKPCELDWKTEKMIRQLKTEVMSLRRKLHNTDDDITDCSRSPTSKSKQRKELRPFDFSKYNKRHVALRIAYLGWDYQGFASQENTEKTIEAELFDALAKARLIECRADSNYSRCGRTDKGVSAFGQVIALDLRSNLSEGVGVIPMERGMASERRGDKTCEIEYTHILNRVLPETIRCLAWTPVHAGFDARFSTLHRTYKYFFPRGDMDIELMQEAALRFIGSHDFRNFCKMDVANGVVNYRRVIYFMGIEPVDDSDGGFRMFVLTVQGQAFLYHQVRCMTAVLFLIGQRKEKPEIIDRLLDIETKPRKPQYSMASEFPLVLYDCAYDGISWIYEQEDQYHNISRLQNMWTQQMVRTAMLRCMVHSLGTVPIPVEDAPSEGLQSINPPSEGLPSKGIPSEGPPSVGILSESPPSEGDQSEGPPNEGLPTSRPWNSLHPDVVRQAASLIQGASTRCHKPLLERPECESLEDRIIHFSKKQRLDSNSALDSKETTDDAAGTVVQ